MTLIFVALHAGEAPAGSDIAKSTSADNAARTRLEVTFDIEAIFSDRLESFITAGGSDLTLG
jgi:hypothetical protein